MTTRLIPILFILLLSNTISSQNESCLQNMNHPGYETIVQSTSSETIVREYILHIPTDHDANSSTPLVIALHGFGDCAYDFFETVGDLYELNKLADEESFIIAYPQAAYRSDKEDNYWEPGDNGAADIFSNDIYFMQEMISTIDDELNVDMNKIYACGYSNGGMMAYSLACNRSSLFAGIGIMSGTMLEEDCTLENPVPIIKFHGIADGVLPYNGSIWYQSVSEVVNFWLDQNEIPSESLVSTSLNEDNVTRDEYSDSDNNSCVTLYTIHEEWDKPGDHVWFSEPINGSTPNEIMWDFLTGSCGAISSSQDDLSSNFLISPNPFLNHIRIHINSSAPLPFTIYNLHRKHIISGMIDANSPIIELSSLAPDMYIINIDGHNSKLIKTK